MLSSAIYPAFGDRPAAFTPASSRGELRRRLGFSGVAITDALETASTEAFGGPTPAARLAARAGTDLLLFASLDAAKQAAKAAAAAWPTGATGSADSVAPGARSCAAGLPGPRLQRVVRRAAGA